ncbi:mannose-1-phosphate guanylyltransferase/mannose-6-phosphate isomerase [Acanthopleuribacter pedis]|uniref:mannose-1-phosphate guanylyltransferase n=1 Tax=Acanthopleuribacter pedis TaxID=442870 RepID=A0A8J7U491_9BACT|nr:mannose-1-phosphate guanylyltransferase/mannose-6-phosphate isomerase [Acanthopleuribacter pedis]
MWPLSTPTRPKPFVDVFALGGPSLFHSTLDRMERCLPEAPIRVVCSPSLAPLVTHSFGERSRRDHLDIILEPEARNTAPAILLAALECLDGDEDAILAVLPADHLIQEEQIFQRALQAAVSEARQGNIVLLGIVPTKAETGYGYIETDPGATRMQATPVIQFVEKPDQYLAQRYLDSGRFFWNSGMFVFRARTMVDAFEQLRPDLLDAVQRHRRGEQGAFAACASISIDYAVMEHFSNKVVIPADLGWCDVGSWNALHDLAQADKHGNAAFGGVTLKDCANTYVRAHDKPVLVMGIQDAVVVDAADGLLVMRKTRDLKAGLAQMARNQQPVLDQSPSTKPDEEPRREERPWGRFSVMSQTPNSKTKRLEVDPGQRTSLQMHHHREEQWVIVEGRARIVKGSDILNLKPGDSVRINRGERHRIENPGTDVLVIIEVQMGTLLIESDVVRFKDDYGRVATDEAVQRLPGESFSA